MEVEGTSEVVRGGASRAKFRCTYPYDRCHDFAHNSVRPKTLLAAVSTLGDAKLPTGDVSKAPEDITADSSSGSVNSGVSTDSIANGSEVAPASTPPAPVASVSCANCFKPGAELRCSVCRKKSYCTVACQRTDWPFHKRICEKPKQANSGASTTASKPSHADAEDASTSQASNTDATSLVVPGDGALGGSSSKVTSDGDIELDAEDLAVLAEVKRKGYAHHARKLADAEVQAIGDIRPKAVSAASIAMKTPSTASLAETSATSSGTPTSLSTGGGSLSSASAWNSANTFESRSLGSWARTRLKELISQARASGELVVSVPGIGRVEVTGISGWGDSTADIVISRGKTRWVYSISFACVASVIPEAVEGDESPAVAIDEVADEVEVDTEKEKEKSAAAAVAGKDTSNDITSAAGGAGGGSGTASDGPLKSSAGSSPRGAAKRHPRMLLRFPYVDNDTEGRAREVRVEWGTPAPSDSQRDLLQRVAAVDSTAGLAAKCRQLVERVVAEFKAK